MRIISKFQDYYDGCLAYGKDENLTYVRKQETVSGVSHTFKNSEADYGFSLRLRLPGSNKIGVFSKFAVGFCGVVHFGWVWESWCGGGKEELYFLKLSQIEQFSKEKNLEEWYNKRNRTLNKLLFCTKDEYLFKKLKTPSFFCKVVYTSRYSEIYQNKTSEKTGLSVYGDIFTNPKLKDYGFSKVLPPMQAFQELSMYLGRGDQQPPVEVSDDVLRDAKGFDEKSFKKQGKKPRRKL